MTVAAGPDEVPGLETGLLCDQMGKQRVRGDIERDAEEDIGAALIKLS